jgi:hypothetical protein
MPPDGRLRLDHHQRLLPVTSDPREKDPEAPAPTFQAWFLRIPLQDCEVLTKGEVLHREGVAGPEDRGDSVIDDRKHAVQATNGSAAA